MIPYSTLAKIVHQWPHLAYMARRANDPRVGPALARTVMTGHASYLTAAELSGIARVAAGKPWEPR